MSSRQREIIKRRLAQREADAIISQASAQQAKAEAEERRSSDDYARANSAQRLARLMIHAANNRNESRSLFKKLFGKKVPVVGYSFESKTLKVFGRDMRQRFSVLSAPVINEQVEFDGEHTFVSGQYVKIRKPLNLLNPAITSPIFAESDRLSFYDMYIMQQITETTSGLGTRNLLYDVNISSGKFLSYTEGVRDDNLLAIGKQAGAHALSLINQTIELFE